MLNRFRNKYEELKLLLKKENFGMKFSFFASDCTGIEYKEELPTNQMNKLYRNIKIWAGDCAGTGRNVCGRKTFLEMLEKACNLW